MTFRFELFPSNLDATVDFYTRVLGFQLTVDRRGESEPCVAVERDGVRIGAAHRPNPDHPARRRPPTGVELVLEVDDLQAELDRVRAAGWPLAEEPRSRPWGLRDFRLLDAGGYYLRITDRAIA